MWKSNLRLILLGMHQGRMSWSIDRKFWGSRRTHQGNYFRLLKKEHGKEVGHGRINIGQIMIRSKQRIPFRRLKKCQGVAKNSPLKKLRKDFRTIQCLEEMSSC